MMKTLEDFKQSPIIDVTHTLIVVKDLAYRFVAVSHGYADYVGLPIHTIFGLSDKDMPWQSQYQNFTDHDIAVRCGDETTQVHHFMNTLNSSPAILLAQKKTILNKKGVQAGTYTHLLPITEWDLKHISSQQPLHRIENLSKKEYLILSMLVMGHSRKTILAKLKISSSTYDTNIHRLKQKFKVSTTHELIISSVKRDLFPLPMEIYP